MLYLGVTVFVDWLEVVDRIYFDRSNGWVNGWMFVVAIIKSTVPAKLFVARFHYYMVAIDPILKCTVHCDPYFYQQGSD